MNYKEAGKIRKSSFGSLLAEQEGGLGESFKKALSLKTKSKITGIKESFDPMNIAKFMTGGSNLAPAIIGKLTGRSKEDVAHFTGAKSKAVGGGDTATRIGSLEQDNSMVDMLMKIYTFMQKSHEDDVKQRERNNQFAEENALEKQKRHNELIKALTGKESQLKTATKLEQDTGMDTPSIVSSILDAFGGARTAMKLLSTLGGFIASPLGVALIGAVVAGTVGAWMVKQIKADPQAALEGKTGIGMAVAGLGSEGQLPEYEQEQLDKASTKKASEVDKKGISKASLQELEAKRQQMIDYGDPRSRVKSGKGDKADLAKAKQLDDIETEINLRKNPPSESPAAASPAAAAAPAPDPVVTAPANDTKLAAVQSQNNDLNIPASKSDPSSVVSNTVNVANNKNSEPKMPIPTVRNQEETFQRMILNSTRVV